jgi:uncharacterized protein
MLPPSDPDARGADVRPPDSGEESLALRSYAFGEWILRWRLAILLVSVLGCLLLGTGAMFLGFNPDTKSFFSPDSPARVQLEKIEAKYAMATNVLMIVTPKSGDVFTPQVLKVLSETTKAAWKTPFTLRVDSLSNYQELSAQGDELSVQALLPQGAISAAQASQVRARALANPELVGRLVSPDGAVTAIAIYINRPRKDRHEVRNIANFVRALAQDVMTKNPDVEVRLTGGVMADLAFAEAGQRDIITLVPLMAAIVTIVLLLGLRSTTVTTTTASVIALTVIATMGIYGWSGAVLNTVTAAAPPVIMTLFFADCVHFVMSAIQQQTHGRDRHRAIVEAIRLNLMPTLIKSATTIIGFLSLNFSDSPPLNQLGNMVAVGSLIGCILTVTLIPVLMSYLPMPKYAAHGRTHSGLAAMANFVVLRNRYLLSGSVIVLAGLALFIPNLKVNDNFIQYFDTSFEFRRDTDYLEQRLTGLHGLVYSIPSGARDGVLEPEYLRKLDAFAAWYRTQPNVVHVATLADVVRRVNRDMNGGGPEFDVVPNDRKLIAQYLMSYEMSLPPGQDLNALIDIGRAESIVTVRLRDVSSKEIIVLAQRGRDWLQAQRFGGDATATGLSVMYSKLTARNIQAMILGTIVSVILVSVIMTLALRSWRLGLISLVVNLAPASAAFGIWALMGSEVNLAISVVTSITYGIVTDDTVQTMTKYRWARDVLGLSPEDAVRETLTFTGGAVILASIALALGFAILGFSTFNITAVMGVLSAMIIAIAALAELVMLPGLLLLFDRRA